MKRFRLPLLSLLYYWRTNLAVLLGMAVGTAALTGALMVGDSVRGSLRRMTLERLGAIDYVMVANSFIGERVAHGLTSSADFKKQFDVIEPALLLTGSIEEAGTSQLARGVNILGVDQAFWALDAFGTPQISQAADGRTVRLNQRLAHEIGAKEGGDVVLRFEKPDPIPAEAMQGRKTGKVVSLRLTVDKILPDHGLARFNLSAGQQIPMNAFVPRATLARLLGHEGEVNTLLVSSVDPPDQPGEDAKEKLQTALASQLSLKDLGLKLRPNADRGYIAVESERMALRESDALAIETTAKRLGLAYAPALTYLANVIGRGEREVPYSTITALDPAAPAPLGPLPLIGGGTAPPLGEREILLNEWTARELNARPGDSIHIAYYATGTVGQLETTEAADFTLRGVVAMEGAGADPLLTPEYPGIHNAQNIRDWDPPFKIDLKKVRDVDEAYWKQYKGTPKAYVSLETGIKLWTSRFGRLTSIRVAPAAGQTLEQASTALSVELGRALKPEAAGLVFRAVKLEGLAASAGATDFSGLFIGFSFFIIIAAMLLVRLLFALGVERRGKEIGLLMASGFSGSDVRRLFMIEGAVLALAGGAAGVALGTGYAAMMLYGLRTWWSGAVGGAALWLEVRPMTIVMGLVAGFVVGLISVFTAVRVLAAAQPGRLLTGGLAFSGSLSTEKESDGARRRSLVIGHALALVAAACIAGSSGASAAARAGLFYGGGAALLAAFLFYFSAILRARPRSLARPGSAWPVAILGARNVSRHQGRSVMTAGLVASATFIIVAVAANRHEGGHAKIEKNSGNGGFALMAESDAPVHVDLNQSEGRDEFNFPARAEAALAASHFFGLRLSPGEDASCLNLYRPQRPRLLGAPPAFIERGGFKFQSSLAESDAEKANPWLLLNGGADEAIPAFGDANTVMWILHSGLGKRIEIEDASGRKIQLRISGLLKGSALQGELVISEKNFLRLYPEQSGFNFYFIETGEPDVDREALEVGLKEYGFDAFSTQERIDNYLAVENTYLSTFLALGGLGFLLGTLGLSAVMLRNVLERRGELALLRAVGYRPSALVTLVLAENGALLLAGLFAGSASALIAVAPTLIEGGGAMPWISLGFTLGAVAVTGMASGALGAIAAVRSPLIEALRST